MEKLKFKIYFEEGKPVSFESNRIIVRRFQKDDWHDLQKIALSNVRSPFADCDEAWPTDDNSIQDMVTYFSQNDPFWAIAAKEVGEVVCFVNFNGIDDHKCLDIGHVMNSDYFGRDYEYEGLWMLYDYAFTYLSIDSIQANWALADKNKLLPLQKLGMKAVNTYSHPKFTENSDGNKSFFEGCTLAIQKVDWINTVYIDGKGNDDV